MSTTRSASASRSTLAEGRPLRLPGRGTTFVREVTGPTGAPTLVLLHGLFATAALNWPRAFDALGQRFHVVAMDQRGHGRGIRALRPFRLQDCADDVIALADVLDVDRVIPVGYSMGGPVALLAARRHPDRVAGIVLCATSARFSDDDSTPLPLSGMVGATLRFTLPAVREQMMAAMLRQVDLPPLLREEARRHDPAALIEATNAVRRFDARSWAGSLEPPAASVVTTRDRLVSPDRQIELARLTRATIHPIEADHEVAARRPDLFLPVLLEAARAVASAAAA